MIILMTKFFKVNCMVMTQRALQMLLGASNIIKIHN